MDNYEKILNSINLIGRHYLHLTEECKNEFCKVSRLITFSKTTTIVREGQYADKTYFLVSGCARAYYLKDGKDITDWFAFENEFICSINSYFLNIASPHYIEVTEPTILLEISRENAEKLSDVFPDFCKLGAMIVTKTMLKLQERIVSIQFKTAYQRYENLLLIRPDISQRVPLTHIASYLGITLETLSRIRNPKNRI